MVWNVELSSLPCFCPLVIEVVVNEDVLDECSGRTVAEIFPQQEMTLTLRGGNPGVI